MTALALPTLDLYRSWAECVAEFGDEPIAGSGIWQLTDGVLEPTYESCAALVGIAERGADPSTALPEGWVHCSQYWVTEVAEVIGFLSLRHGLNAHLREVGGHIGYSIRPSYRRRGHASQALRLGLARARDLGLERVLLTCDEDNVGSLRTIESQGGVLEDIRDGKRRYWIDL